MGTTPNRPIFAIFFVLAAFVVNFNPVACQPARAEVLAKTGRDGKVMVWIPGGTFTMGDRWGDGESDERPAHAEMVEGFWMDQTEVTNAEFQRFVEATNYRPRGSWSHSWTYAPDRENYPADFITWDDAVAYARWAGKRLPTEKEWEYAAGGPLHTKWSLGNRFDETLYSFKRFPGEMTALGPEPVKSHPPNSWGLYDMGGNVSEWTADYYHRYPGNTDNNAFYGEEYRVVRGGSWWTMDEAGLRVSARNWLRPSQDDGRGTPSES
ncbi:MAG: formylglycine-generating enzyme family protein [Firmicutes bacterium]|nr:formylglycine-generating enzyme family protein [Bacillota bacterium]